MTDKELQIAIAKACGWTEIEECLCCDMSRGRDPNRTTHPYKRHLPNYLNSLDAMHEAEESMSLENRFRFAERLGKLIDLDGVGIWDYADAFNHCHATARQRAEAFALTLGLKAA